MMAGAQSVAVTLPNDTVYVSGTVNGADYVFALTGTTSQGTIWTADVPRAVPDVYVCVITATASTGTSTTIEVTLYYGLIDLITDRTRQDVDRAIDLSAKGLADMTAEELTEFAVGLRGAYNATDLNRVESAVQYICERLTVAGVYHDLVLRNTWERKDLPVIAEMERYLNNIRKLRASLAMPKDTPEVPADMNRLTFSEANDIETILVTIDSIISNIILSWYYSGELYSGEV